MLEPEVVMDVQGLVRRYGDFVAVDRVEFQVRRGEIFGLLGPNGAGKSTLIGMLTGVLAPSDGRASICSLDLLTQREAIKKLVGLVPQDLALYQTLTARDNLAFFASLHEIKGKLLEQRIQFALALAQLEDWADKPVRSYSGGMKRRLNLAVALLHRPRILFLDEPTVGVDPQSRNHIFDCIRQLAAEGLTVFYTTHYMEEAQSLCDRVGIFDRGRMIALDTPKNLVQTTRSRLLEVGVLHLPGSVLQEIKAMEGVEQATEENGLLLVTAVDIPAVAVKVLSLLAERKVSFTSVNTPEVNLETVFLQLTGKTLRD
ncbi:MAG: ABC transporter ATP-binding protein [Desulfurispora sp.]|uniref:ABC transporter ATP-binding protein n=1 Tax=Desulfurispora sp. TaxID=3014275 RepID=UPI004048F984